MKKNLLLILFFAIGTFTISNAQMTFKYGPEIGLHLSKSNLEDTDEIESKAIIGQKIGILTELKFGKILAIQPGLFYNTVGYKTSTDDLGLLSGSSFKTTFTNITLPVYINAEFGGATKFFIGAGPELNFIASGKYSGQLLGVDFDDEKIDLKDAEINRMYVSANINLGLKFNDRLQFRLNYNLGLTGLTDKEENNDADPLKLGNYGISVAYLFGGN